MKMDIGETCQVCRTAGRIRVTKIGGGGEREREIERETDDGLMQLGLCLADDLQGFRDVCFDCPEPCKLHALQRESDIYIYIYIYV